MSRPILIEPQAGGTHGIVIASRDAYTRDLLRATLGPVTRRLFVTETEDETVSAVQSSRPVLVLIDYDLFDGDGAAACRRIRKSREAGSPIVVLVSAHAEETYRHRAEEAGAAAFLTKPFSPLWLVDFAEQVARASWPAAARLLRAHQRRAG